MVSSDERDLLEVFSGRVKLFVARDGKQRQVRFITDAGVVGEFEPDGLLERRAFDKIVERFTEKKK